MDGPFTIPILVRLGPIPIATPVVVSWAIMAVLALGSWLATRSLSLTPSRRQTVVELMVAGLEDQIRETLQQPPRPFLPFIGTLFLFILTANWSFLVPGIEPPTRYIETDVALALTVFLAVILFGVRQHGAAGYLKTFAEPMIAMLPINIIEMFTRILSLIVRLFGNVMSGVFIVGIVLSLAGLIVPVPLMALHLLTGAIQAYIFTILTAVFIGSAVAPVNPASEGPET